MMRYAETGPYDFDVDLQISESNYDVANNSLSGVNYEISHFFSSTSVTTCKLLHVEFYMHFNNTRVLF